MGQQPTLWPKGVQATLSLSQEDRQQLVEPQEDTTITNHSVASRIS